MLDEMKLLKDSAARAEMEKDKLSAAFGLLDTKAKHEHAFKMEEMGKLGEEIMQKNLKLKDQIREIADKDLMVNSKGNKLTKCRFTSYRYRLMKQDVSTNLPKIKLN